jgi:hypothetical protein
MKYKIAAVDVYIDKPQRIYINTSDGQVTELSRVIMIDFNSRQIYSPQYLGSYAKFGSNIRYIDAGKDNIEEIEYQIESLPLSKKIHLSEMIKGKEDIKDEGFMNYYNLNDYLFQVINKRFHENGSLDAADFFCIVIWKANRVKSIIASRLLKIFKTLDDASRTITSHLHNENISDYDRFQYLLGLGFRLPMLSAILTVLFPERFLVYDYRICSHPEFYEFKKLENPSKDPQADWKLYQSYIHTVIINTPSWMSLRQKDQYLWGKSFALQLKNDVDNNFGIN